MLTTEPFLVGTAYVTQEGKKVTITSQRNKNGPYWIVRGSDGLWRYNRPQDRGRVTASRLDMSCPQNLVPLSTPKGVA